MKIGIIDSGMGGYYFYLNIKKRYPKHEFVLIKDTCFFPYGTKTPKILLQRFEILNAKLRNIGCIKTIVACNTLSTNIQINGIDVLGVVTPVIDYMNNQKYQKPAIIATYNTIKSNIFQKSFPNAYMILGTNLISEVENKLNVNQVLIDMINFIPSDCDCLVLGCTHLIGIKHLIYPKITIDVISVDEIFKL